MKKDPCNVGSCVLETEYVPEADDTLVFVVPDFHLDIIVVPVLYARHHREDHVCRRSSMVASLSTRAL